MKPINFTKYISFLLVAYAFSFPVSRALTNTLEVLLVLLWLLEGNWEEKYNLYKRNLLSLSIFLLIGFSALSILWHGDVEVSLRYIAKYHHLITIFIFYSSFDRTYTKHVFSAFFLAVFASELLSYGIFFELIHYKNVSPRDPTPFMSHMAYSSVLAFTVSALLVKAYYEKTLKYRLGYLFFSLTASINLFVNGGKTGQVIFIVLIFIIGLHFIKSKIKAILIAVSTLTVVFLLAFNYSPNFKNRSIQLYNGLDKMILEHDFDHSGSRRVALSILGVDTFLDNPFLGTGLSYNMAHAEQYLKSNNFNLKNIKHYADYHSAFITISVQLGIIGLFISLMIIYALFTFKINSKEDKLISYLFATTFVLFSLTHNTLHTMSPMTFFALFAGLLNQPQIKKTNGPKIHRS